MRVTILDLKWSYGIEEITEILHTRLGEYCDVDVISGTESRLDYSFKIAPSRSYAQMVAALFNPLVYLRLFRFLSRSKPDVLYVISPHMMNVVVALGCRLFTNITVISHIHDPSPFNSPLVSGTASAVCYGQCKLSHRIYCWGDAIRSAICAKYGLRKDTVRVFRHGPGQATRIEEYPNGWSSPPLKYFSMVGSMQERKGIGFFLEAARLFNEEFGADKVQFLLAGSGDIEEYRVAMAALPNLRVENRFVQDSEVNDLLAESYALVLPYVGGVLQSSFVAIAYGNGCPVIVSRLGSLPEEVDDGQTGFIVDQKNPAQISKAMMEVYSRPRDFFMANCLEAYREKFSWDRLGEEFYRDMEATTVSRSTQTCSSDQKA